MSDNIFDRFLDAADQARIPLRTAQSRDWFLKKARSDAKNYTFGKLEKEARGKFRQRMGIGKMYFFQYDAKYKDTLPYWDKFPLIIPIDIGKKHILGCNLHYLHPKTRAVILAKLMDIASDQRYNERTKIRLSYGIVKSLTKYKLLKPTIKKYLKSHFRSKYILVDAEEWEIAIQLPVQRFQKSSNTNVYRESRKKVT